MYTRCYPNIHCYSLPIAVCHLSQLMGMAGLCTENLTAVKETEFRDIVTLICPQKQSHLKKDILVPPAYSYTTCVLRDLQYLQ